MSPENKSTGVNCRRPGAPFSRTLGVLVLLVAIETMLPPASASPSRPAANLNWKDFDVSIASSQHLMMTDPGAALARARAGETIAKRDVSSPRYAEARAT